jgi:hypothetical protein
MHNSMPSLLSGLQAYWPLHEASGVRYEASGNGMDLNDINTVTGNPGRVENAGQFTIANSEYLARGSDAKIQTGNIDFTWCGWVYLDAVATTQVIVGKDGSTAGQRDYLLYYSNGQGFLFSVFTATDVAKLVIATTPGVANTAQWYFVQGWHDAAADLVWIQVDNNVPFSAASGTLQAASNAEFDIGARVFVGSRLFFGGRICEVGFWRRILTLQERMWLWNRGMGRTYPFDGRISPVMLGRGHGQFGRRVLRVPGIVA